MKYAIIELGGKQFKIQEGDTFKLERQKALSFGVLMYSDGKETLIGQPTLANIDIKAEIIGVERAKKIRVARFKSKSRYRKVRGHKQPLSVVKVEKISKKSSTKKAVAETEKPKTAKSTTKKVSNPKGAAPKKKRGLAVIS